MSSIIDKTNICVIVSCFPQTAVDNSLLGLTLRSWTDQGYDIFLTSHSPVTQDIQRECKYFTYSDENEMLKYEKVSNLTWYHGTGDFIYYTNWGNTMGKHSYAIVNNMKNAMQLLEIKKYTHFIFIDDDSFLTDDEHKILEDKLVTNNFLNKDYFFFIENDTETLLPVSTLFGGRVSHFNQTLSKIQSTKDYLDYCEPTGGYSLENYLGRAFVVEGNQNGWLENYPLRSIFHNEWIGASQSGVVRVPGLKNYDWWLDIVKESNNNDFIYFIVSQTNHNVEGKILMYLDDVLVNEMNLTTGPFYWFRIDANQGKKWRIEHEVKNKIVKKIEYEVQDVLNNIYSFIEFRN